MDSNFKIVIADDHPLLLEGAIAIIKEAFPDAEIISTKNGAEALDRIISLKPDLSVLDIEMPFMSGIEIAEKIKHHNIKTKIVFLTLHKERSFFEKIKELGANGYMLKEQSSHDMVACIKTVMEGGFFYSEKLESFLEDEDSIPELTKTEKHIVNLISKGKSSKEVAEMLFVSLKTVESHRHNICKKLNLPPEKNSLLKWIMQNKSKIKD